MAKIIAFPGKQQPGRPAAGKKKTGPALPDWVEHIGCSPWWRLADFLVREAADSPFKLGPGGELPESIVSEAREICPPHPGGRPCDDLDEVRSILENLGYLQSNRKSLFLDRSAEVVIAHPWRLWADIQTWLVREHVWTGSRQPGCGIFFRDSVSSSLGYLRAVCENGPVPGTRLLDLLESCLQFGSQLKATGLELIPPKPRFGPPSPGRPLFPWEEDWFDLVVDGFAQPLGLVSSRRQIPTSENAGAAWNERRPYETLRVEATELLKSL